MYRATQYALRRLGQPNRPALKTHQSSHDLCVAELYVALRQRWPRAASLWQGEDMFSPQRGFREKVEDSLLVREGKPILAIEVGAYRADTFAEKFRDFAARQLSFRCY